MEAQERWTPILDYAMGQAAKWATPTKPAYVEQFRDMLNNSGMYRTSDRKPTRMPDNYQLLRTIEVKDITTK